VAAENAATAMVTRLLIILLPSPIRRDCRTSPYGNPRLDHRRSRSREETADNGRKGRQPMHSAHFIAETSSDGVVERDFIVGEVPGVLWSPVSGSAHAPVVLMGHGGGPHKKTPTQVARPATT